MEFFDKRLVEIAKTIGFTNEQINAASDENALRDSILQIKPQYMTELIPQESAKPKPVVAAPVLRGKAERHEMSILIDERAAAYLNRVTVDESKIQSFMRLNRIQNVTLIEIERNYVPIKGILTTNVVIHCRKG